MIQTLLIVFTAALVLQLIALLIATSCYGYARKREDARLMEKTILWINRFELSFAIANSIAFIAAAVVIMMVSEDKILKTVMFVFATICVIILHLIANIFLR